MKRSTLPFGLRSVRADEALHRAALAHRGSKGDGLPVGEGVVGEDALHHDAVGGEECRGACPERRRRGAAFIAADLGVGEPAVIVHRGVDVVEADSQRVSALAPPNAPATAGWNPPQLLDIDVDQIARVFVLVAADHTPRGSIHPAQPVQLLAHQHAMHRRGRHVEAHPNANRAQLGAPPQRLDLSLHSR